MNLFESLNWRYAVREFSDERIDDEKVTELLNLTRLSATSYGLQPYRLIVINDTDLRQSLLKYSMGQEKVVKSSHLVVIAVRAKIDDLMIERYLEDVARKRGIRPEELEGFGNHVKAVFAGMSVDEKRIWAHQQAYIALGTLLTVASIMKIDSCPMGGFEAAGYDQVLGLDRFGLESSVICALGSRHPEDSSARLPKVRYDYNEMVINLTNENIGEGNGG